MSEPKKWFKRTGWHRMQIDVRPPLWHAFKQLNHGAGEGSGSKMIQVIALCGYRQHAFKALSADGNGLSEFYWKDEVKTKKLRCTRCDTAISRQEKK